MTFNVEILRPLAAGGNGDIVLARRTDTGDLVVVKYLREYQNPETRRTFQREMRILQRGLSGVVSLLAYDNQGLRPYYVMPYMPGGSLTQWVGKLTAEQLRGVSLEMAATIQRFHAHGIYHGDCKPDNVLVDQKGRLMIADPLGNGWGCTVLFSENRGGTPGYWAPEIGNGATISPAGDVYAYGATLYHLATGRRPVDGDRPDVLVQSCECEARVRATIVACCHPIANNRPSMADAIRILGGAEWSAIRSERTNLIDGIVKGVLVGCCIGLLVHLVSGPKA